MFLEAGCPSAIPEGIRGGVWLLANSPVNWTVRLSTRALDPAAGVHIRVLTLTSHRTLDIYCTSLCLSFLIHTMRMMKITALHGLQGKWNACMLRVENGTWHTEALHKCQRRPILGEEAGTPEPSSVLTGQEWPASEM